MRSRSYCALAWTSLIVTFWSGVTAATSGSAASRDASAAGNETEKPRRAVVYVKPTAPPYRWTRVSTTAETAPVPGARRTTYDDVSVAEAGAAGSAAATGPTSAAVTRAR